MIFYNMIKKSVWYVPSLWLKKSEITQKCKTAEILVLRVKGRVASPYFWTFSVQWDSWPLPLAKFSNLGEAPDQRVPKKANKSVNRRETIT